LSDEQAIRDVIARWHAATAAGNVSRILPLMAEDAVFLTAGHPPMRGRDAFAAQLRGLLEKARVESSGEPKEIRVSGDLAYCWSELRVVVIPCDSSPPVRRAGPTLTIFRRQADGGWVLSRDANLLTAEAAG
jgi:uncharacterized protein (TIGR02246 family)